MPKRPSSPVNKRNLRIQVTKPNYSDSEKRKSPRNLNLNNKTKPAESHLQQKPTGKKRAVNSANQSSEDPEVPSAFEQNLDKIAAAKSETLKLVLDDLNSKIASSSSQL